MPTAAVPVGSMPRLDCAAVTRLGLGEPLVFDGVLGQQASADLIGILTADRGALVPAAIGRGGVHAPLVRGDHTRWLEPTPTWPIGALWRLFDHVGRELCENAWLGTRETEVQLAFYPGDGALYERHRDAFVGRGRRRATAIYYLNPSWLSGDGGELRIFVADRQIDIEPQADRLVLFLADAVDHAVLPCRAARWAVTAWYLGPPQVPLARSVHEPRS